MKKGFTLFFAMTLALSVSATPVAAKPGNGKAPVSSTQKEVEKNEASMVSAGESTEESSEVSTSTEAVKQKEKVKNEVKNESKEEIKKEETKKEETKKEETKKEVKNEGNNQTNKKVFKDELNEQKKELQKEKSSLAQQVDELQLQYEDMLAEGDTEGADAILDTINTLQAEMQGVQAQIKETINERYMVVKTMYSDEELAEFSNAAELISEMYDDARVLSAGSVVVNNNLIKFDAPAYIKNGVTLVPLRAIAEELGGQVSWDATTQTVTITNGDTEVQITADSTTGLVNGKTVEISAPATKNCGRTYVPLRFLAETLGFDTEWDSENGLIDISDETESTEADGEEALAEKTSEEDGAEVSAEEATATEETVADATEVVEEETPSEEDTKTVTEEEVDASVESTNEGI